MQAQSNKHRHPFGAGQRKRVYRGTVPVHPVHRSHWLSLDSKTRPQERRNRIHNRLSHHVKAVELRGERSYMVLDTFARRSILFQRHWQYGRHLLQPACPTSPMVFVGRYVVGASLYRSLPKRSRLLQVVSSMTCLLYTSPSPRD